MNKIKQVSFIPKEFSKYIYGICILMMLWHHLFGFPERFNDGFTSILGSNVFILYTMIGYFCKICVSIYAFMTGYGLMAKYFSTEVSIFNLFSQMFNRILNFYLKYWIVLIVFLMIGIILNVYTFNFIEFIKNAIGLSCIYNAEWWYVGYYLKMLLLFPLIYFVLKKSNNINTIIYFVICLIYFYINSWNGAQVYLSYIIGILSVYFNDYFVRLIDKTNKNVFVSLIIILICDVLLVPVYLKTYVSNEFNFVFSFIFIYGLIHLLVLLKKYSCFSPILFIFEKIGNQNMYMWLTHTFFIYYFFKPCFEFLNNGILAYFILVAISYVTSISLNFIHGKISSRRI